MWRNLKTPLLLFHVYNPNRSFLSRWHNSPTSPLAHMHWPRQQQQQWHVTVLCSYCRSYWVCFSFHQSTQAPNLICSVHHLLLYVHVPRLILGFWCLSLATLRRHTCLLQCFHWFCVDIHISRVISYVYCFKNKRKKNRSVESPFEHGLKLLHVASDVSFWEILIEAICEQVLTYTQVSAAKPRSNIVVTEQLPVPPRSRLLIINNKHAFK